MVASKKLDMLERPNDYYNSIDLNNIFNDDDILGEWIREEKQPVLPPDDISWLDEGIHRSDESGCDSGDDDDVGDGGNGGNDDGGNGGDGGDDDDGDYGDNYEETHGVGGSQRGGVMTWDSEYYAT